MKNIVSLIALTLGTVIASTAALAGTVTPLPEPMSVSLVAGGIVAIAITKRMRRK